MRITQVTRRFVRSAWGGTETAVLETSKQLLALGHETEIVTTNALADSDEELMDGVQVRRVPYFYPYVGLDHEARGKMDQKGGNMFSFRLLRLLGRQPLPDLIHLHTGKRIGGIARTVARRRGIPYVITLHGGFFDVPQEEVSAWTEPSKGAVEWGKVLGWWVGSRRVLEDAQAILCVGLEEHRRASEAFPGKRVIHMPNGVDPDRFRDGDGPRFRSRWGIPQAAPLLLNVGRIDPQKNQMQAIRTLHGLSGAHPNAHLALIGPVSDPRYKEELEREVGRLELQGRVTIIPGLPAEGQELVDAYHASDVFLLPSIHEPFGIVILEAWAAGVPVVASAIGGVPSFVTNGMSGLLVPSRDLEAMVASTNLILANPFARDTLAKGGYLKANRSFSWTQLTHRLVEVYRTVVDERSHAGETADSNRMEVA